MLKKIILLLASTTFLGCPSTVETSDTKVYDDITKYRTDAQSDTSNTESTYDTEVKNNLGGDKLTLEAKVTNIISPLQKFIYSSVPIPESEINITFSDTGLDIEMKEHQFIWISSYTIKESFEGKVFPSYTVYTCIAQDKLGRDVPVEIKINEDNSISYLKVGTRIFSNKSITLSAKTSLVKELEPGSVEVRKGETFRILVDKYNKQFGTNHTVESVQKYNNLKSTKTVVGQIIKFPS